jgi:hypothetical protein
MSAFAVDDWSRGRHAPAGASRFDRRAEETDATAADLAQPERQQILG